jgi:putative NADPH-quinone reductase
VQKSLHILVVLADVSSRKPTNFSIARQVSKEYCNTVKESGCTVEYIDLFEDYTKHFFDPILDKGEPGSGVMEYQVKVRQADQIVFFYQTIHGTMPALMKGFVDVVFRPPFAFANQTENMLYKNEGHLGDKGGTVFIFDANDWTHSKIVNNNFDQTFWTRSVFAHTGIKGQVKYFYNTDKLNFEKFEALKEEVKKYAGIFRVPAFQR